MSHDQVIALASKITDDLMQGQVQEISTTHLGEMVMKQLQALDLIAYIRFACVYRRFKDLKELEEAIDTIQSKDETNIC
jgi:transcriptional repressor NrdR